MGIAFEVGDKCGAITEKQAFSASMTGCAAGHTLAVKYVLTSTGRKRHGFLPVFLQTAAEKIKITVYVSRFNVLI